ncbi:hypothetical protein CDAR_577431 [Caerostris darwini]|uniref:Uncharacterized protein n=1 Tax=Caerostris darwini TaxID=1538125 RepID=A0AAV4U3X8_9ARAC|nr:hypothetical protein CDAR_577431 [Caerostris darwini]
MNKNYTKEANNNKAELLFSKPNFLCIIKSAGCLRFNVLQRERSINQQGKFCIVSFLSIQPEMGLACAIMGFLLCATDGLLMAESVNLCGPRFVIGKPLTDGVESRNR